MIRILLAEDMHMVRGALVALLELEPDFRVVAEVADGRGILPSVIKLRPDVAILDIDLPGVNGLDAARLLWERAPDCRVIILTALEQRGTVRRAIDAHVRGFLPKNAPPGELAAAIRMVHSGRRVIDSRIPPTAWEAEDCPLADRPTDSPLTRRETEVLKRAADGNSARETAREMHLSTGTVRNYLTSAVTKLTARNQLDAVRIAKEKGWIR
ncbi:response regulator transcription factor [Streptomyces albireticuli]|uniref:DNA-binding response regulator n=1 Tax=Streptomyces albireticuli TaxID=1940 RepID=A0A2A2D2D8_9ACTN|nr:response regulator transcription factor [Streptomyces albireticuli]MCD9140876.1 response regulator transcription factor [Streptomyces albireticuli]MCD9161162.1 response regulator transcription factor [Streptomyces albireticuli]MCD9190780.1 response regulator transcription factor [Streptomyces albireticuli]PAU45694.1 DNA-binding response regulator [Streptomyces albireticuli]